MTYDRAIEVIKCLKARHKAFKPIGNPVITANGARIQFAVTPQKPEAVISWFEGAGVYASMIGFEDVYDNGGTMYAIFREWGV